MNNNTGVEEVIMADRRLEQLSFTQYVASGAMCNVCGCDARGEIVTDNMASNKKSAMCFMKLTLKKN